MPSDKGAAGKPRNLLTRSPNINEVGMDQEQQGEGDLAEPVPDTDGLPVLLPPPSDYQAGDLIEMYDDGDRAALLAVCLGHINGTYHLYTANGKWMPMSRINSHFVVKNFVSEMEMEPAFEKLPKDDLPPETLRAMRELKMGPDRVSGAQLLRKMARFQEQYEKVLQSFATSFEKAHEILAEGKERYLTLEQMATRLMGKAGDAAPLEHVHRPASLICCPPYYHQ